MARIADSTHRVQFAANLGGSQVARRLRAPSSASSRPKSDRTAEVRWLTADQSVKNVGSAAKVVDDLLEAIPVTCRELEVIETYLSAVLDECLGATD